jgi:hypothetical protein
LHKNFEVSRFHSLLCRQEGHQSRRYRHYKYNFSQCYIDISFESTFCDRQTVALLQEYSWREEERGTAKEISWLFPFFFENYQRKVNF